MRNHYDSDSDIDRNTSFSGPLPTRRPSNKSATFSLPHDDDGKDQQDYVEITLDKTDDSVAVHSVQAAASAGGGGQHQMVTEGPELTLTAKRTLETKSSLGSSFFRNTSSKIMQVSQELKRLAKSRSHAPTTRFDRNKSAAAHALKGLKFIATTKPGADAASAWITVEKRFDKLTKSTDGLLPCSLFGECIGMNNESKVSNTKKEKEENKESKPKDFAGELFGALARRYKIRGDSINKEQLKLFWDQISDPSFDSRLQTFFDMVDKDADGRITEDEVREIISLSASANQLSTIQKQATEYAALIMEELDPENVGYIMIYNFETLLLQAPNQSVRIGESKNLSQLLSQKLKPTLESNPLMRWYQRTKYFISDNWRRVWILMLWIGIVLGLFAYKFVQYRHKAAYEVMGYCVCTAKGAAETLKFNMAIILLPVCRNTITWLRNKTKLGRAIPFDDNLNFHKIIAVGIAIGVGLHAGAHLTCDFPRLLHATEEEYEVMEPYFGEKQPPNYWWFVKGVEGVTGIVMVVLMTIAFTLATPWFKQNKIKNLPKTLQKLTGFNAFWYSHHLFVIVYVLLIVHGIFLYLTKKWYYRTTWMYLTVPVLLYACERLIRAFRSSIKSVRILKVSVYPGNVLALHMTKPQGFKYKSGQYMFVNCAAVSPFEWHPFSITSAPGDEYLSVHIRTLGDWTRQLKTVFSQVCQVPTGGKSGLPRADYLQEGGEDGVIFPRILIDGAYGAPAQEYKEYEVVLLVGLGIGATPMISIVKDIIDNIMTNDQELGSLERGSTSNEEKKSNERGGTASGGKGFKIKRAYLYWVTREQGTFEWFKDIMNEVAEMDVNSVIELHNYCTNVYEEGDARSALIAMLQSLQHAKNGVDVVSGTRVKSHFAKPNWREVFKRIALKHPDSRVGVFYCGAPALTKELKQLALDFSHRTSTKFEFHKENF